MKYYGWLSIFKGLLMHFNVTLEVVVCRGWWTKITGVCAFKLCIGRERSSMFYFHDSKGHPRGNSEPPFRTPVRSFRGIRTTVAYTVHPCGRSRRHLAHDRVHSAGITTPNPPVRSPNGGGDDDARYGAFDLVFLLTTGTVTVHWRWRRDFSIGPVALRAAGTRIPENLDTMAISRLRLMDFFCYPRSNSDAKHIIIREREQKYTFNFVKGH